MNYVNPFYIPFHPGVAVYTESFTHQNFGSPEDIFAAPFSKLQKPALRKLTSHLLQAAQDLDCELYEEFIFFVLTHWGRIQAGIEMYSGDILQHLMAENDLFLEIGNLHQKLHGYHPTPEPFLLTYQATVNLILHFESNQQTQIKNLFDTFTDLSKC